MSAVTVWALPPAYNNSSLPNQTYDYFAPAVGRQSQSFVLKDTDVLAPAVRNLIGEGGARRFEEFRCYPAGWDHGTGKSLSFRSVAVLESFVHQLTAPDAICRPSLFLTRAGNLQLGWDDSASMPVEVEFFPDRLEFFIGAADEEGTVAADQAGLAQLISKLQHNRKDEPT